MRSPSHLFALAALFLSLSCGGDGDEPPGPLELLDVSVEPAVLHPTQAAIFTAVIRGGEGNVTVTLMRGQLAVTPLTEVAEMPGTWTVMLAWEDIAQELALTGAPGEAVEADLRISVRDGSGAELTLPAVVSLVCDYASQSVCTNGCVEGSCG